MKHRLFAMSLLALSAFCFTACDEGEYTNLECDSASYASECLDGTHYMWCNNGSLIVTACATGNHCAVKDNAARCVASE